MIEIKVFQVFGNYWHYLLVVDGVSIMRSKECWRWREQAKNRQSSLGD
jgi:hypothetical protein